jgi:hypothetical protein
MDELRKMFPAQIVRGALLRPDGVAVGLVSGGTPAWDLLSRAARGQAGSEYHRLLLSLDAPIDLYVVDQPPDLAGEIATLLSRRDGSDMPVLTAIRSAIADYLTELASQSGSRAKQTIWAVAATSSTTARGVLSLDIPRLIGHHAGGGAAAGGTSASPALSQALERARRLADAHSQLGGTPAARLMEAEEIARLLYSLADPVRAQRYPLAGTLLDRVRRVVTTIH